MKLTGLKVIPLLHGYCIVCVSALALCCNVRIVALFMVWYSVGAKFITDWHIFVGLIVELLPCGCRPIYQARCLLMKQQACTSVQRLPC